MKAKTTTLDVEDGLSYELRLDVPRAELDEDGNDTGKEPSEYHSVEVTNKTPDTITVYLNTGNGGGGASYTTDIEPDERLSFSGVSAGDYVTLRVGNLDDGQITVRSSKRASKADDTELVHLGFTVEKA